MTWSNILAVNNGVPSPHRPKPLPLFLWGNANRLPVPTTLIPTLITLCPSSAPRKLQQIYVAGDHRCHASAPTAAGSSCGQSDRVDTRGECQIEIRYPELMYTYPMD